MFQSLLTSKRFAPIFVVQFFSALSDNFIKNALVILILFKMGTEAGRCAGHTGRRGPDYADVLLSALGGELADKFDKARVARWLKVAEIPIAMIAGLRLHSEFNPIAVCLDRPLRLRRCFVRPDQVRHFAGSSGTAGIAGRQRARRRGDVPCHPARHHTRWPCDDGTAEWCRVAGVGDCSRHPVVFAAIGWISARRSCRPGAADLN